MKSLTKTIISWKMIEIKLPISMVWIGSWRKTCLYSRVWSRQSNIMIEPRKIAPWQKMINLPAVQTRNRGRKKPPRDWNEMKSNP